MSSAETRHGNPTVTNVLTSSQLLDGRETAYAAQGRATPARAPALEPSSERGGVVTFGPFKLAALARTLERNGEPVKLGSRALDILIVLVERAGEIVGHRELLARVWRGLVVDSGNLRVHLTSLRKALDGGEAYICNVPGQGYCFVARVDRGGTGDTPAIAERELAAAPGFALPPPLARMLGRADAVRRIMSDLVASRFVTIVAPGGMGKTTVAIAIAHAFRDEFPGAVCYVDLSTVSDATQVSTAVAAALGVSARPQEIDSAIVEHLRAARMLMILDNCEHVIDSTALLAERIFTGTCGVHVLATSREALRAEGEIAIELPPLAAPAAGLELSASEALSFPAIALFVERIGAARSGFELDEASTPVVAHICRKLDGIPLAIECAASRASTNGVVDTARLLDAGFGVCWEGRRTAPPRHQTLRALLDWSHDLLRDTERRVLRRLALLAGAFTLQSAQVIARGTDLSDEQVASALARLVAASLARTTLESDGSTRYQLLETTRAYARVKLEESGESKRIARQRIRYAATMLESRASLQACAT